MNVKDALNRGFNLLAVSIVGLSGFAFLPEAFLENDWGDKADDIFLFILGVIGIFWYRKNKTVRSFVPLLLVILALATKIGAIIVEFSDPDSVGDDFGALILFVLSVALVWYEYNKTKKLLDAV